MWVRFTADFDWKPTPQSIIAYKAGMEQNVTRACAEAALSADKAVKCSRRKEAGNGEA